MSVLKMKDENGNWVGIPTIKGEKGDPGDLVPHSYRHYKGAGDEILPSDIGAADAKHTHSLADLGAAPLSHASTSTTHGAGDSNNYGHVKLSDSVSSTSGASAGIAATPAAVKRVYDIANGKAPAYTYGTADVEAGSASPYENGTLHFVYE